MIERTFPPLNIWWVRTQKFSSKLQAECSFTHPTNFGHFKDEVNYKKCNNFKELKDKIDRYVYYYNTSRYQWNKNMLAPIEVREHLFAYNYCPF